jgi:Flp pilus assembly protein TadG
MLTIRAFVSLLQRRVRCLVGDERGVSAIEFAMILPLMVTLYLGSIELSEGIAIDRKVTVAARTVADLVSQANPSITETEVSDLLGAGSVVMAPYPAVTGGGTRLLRVVVTQLKIDAQKNVTVDWSRSLPTGYALSGSYSSLPEAFKVPNSYLVLGQAQYDFKPSFVGQFIKNTITIKDQVYMRVRQQSCVKVAPTAAVC